MDKNLHNNNDGLEDFFRDRLSGYQDEPGADMWERIDSCIPEKPKKNYKPILLWTGRAAAACIIFTLAIFNYQYSNQLDIVADQLQHSKESMASLENKINDYYFNRNNQVAAVVATEEEKINADPTRIEQVIYRPEVVYLPMPAPQYVNAPIVANQPMTAPFTTKSNDSHQEIAEQPKKHINAPIQQKKHEKSMITMPAMAFAKSAFNTAKKEDVLNLKKKLLNRKMAVNRKKVKSPNSRFVMKKGNWCVGNNHSGIVNNLPQSRTASQKKGLRGGSMMKTWASDGNRMLTADKHTNWDKVLGVGANYSINNKVSFFMTPDYTLEKPRSLSTNNLYEYAVGIESGLTYHF